MIGAEELFAALSDAWVEFRGIWDKGRGFAEIRRLWLERAAGLGEPVAIKYRNGDRRGHLRYHRRDRLPDRPHGGRQAHADHRGRGLFRRRGVGGSGLMARPDELTFAPLGGVGEIGMNLSIYGLGNRHQRSWLAVDLGVSFGDEEHLPGIDLIMPDIRFLEKERKNLMGLVLTHAHEDHFGAIIDLWPKLQCPIYATKFSAALFEAKCAAERNPPKIPVTVVPSGGRIDLGPFNVEFIPVAHSIPESHALAIHTSVGTVLHTGDWKIDPTPIIGLPTDERRLRELGDAGVLALIGDSTNAVREGRSPSETEVATTITEAGESRQGPRRRHHLRLQRRPPEGRGGCRQGRRPRGGRGRPRHGARGAGGARDRLSRRRAEFPRRRSITAISRRTRCWRCAPAARASRARRWRGSPMTTIRR